MVIALIRWGDSTAYVRDPVVSGDFIRGVHCNEKGVSVRTEGCTEDAELMIYRPAILSYTEVEWVDGMLRQVNPEN